MIFYSSLRDPQTKASCSFPLACVHIQDTHIWNMDSRCPISCSLFCSRTHIHNTFIHTHTSARTHTSCPSTRLLVRLQHIFVGPFVPRMSPRRLLLLAYSTAFPMRPCCRPLISTLLPALQCGRFKDPQHREDEPHVEVTCSLPITIYVSSCFIFIHSFLE